MFLLYFGVEVSEYQFCMKMWVCVNCIKQACGLISERSVVTFDCNYLHGMFFKWNVRGQNWHRSLCVFLCWECEHITWMISHDEQYWPRAVSKFKKRGNVKKSRLKSEFKLENASARGASAACEGVQLQHGVESEKKVECRKFLKTFQLWCAGGKENQQVKNWARVKV